jgi:hypothetical protein
VTERVYYRHFRDGNRGYLVERDGQQCIKLDRPNEDIVRPFKDAEWLPERENRPCTKAQITKVAFEADKALCGALGMFVEAKREWLNMKEPKRIAWMAGAASPPSELRGLRKELYQRIMALLEPIATE